MMLMGILVDMPRRVAAEELSTLESQPVSASPEATDGEQDEAIACRIEVSSDPARCEILWKCGDSVTVLLDKTQQASREGACSFDHDTAVAAKLPASGSDGTTFDVFTFSDHLGNGSVPPPEYVIVAARGKSAKAFGEVSLGFGVSIAIVEAAAESTLVLTSPSIATKVGTRCTVSASKIRCSTLAPLKPIKRETVTVRGYVEKGSHADGYGHNVFVPNAEKLHVDDEGACGLQRIGEGNAQLVIEKSSYPDGRTVSICKAAKKLGRFDVPWRKHCGRFETFDDTQSATDIRVVRDVRTGLLWTLSPARDRYLLSTYAFAKAGCEAHASLIGRPTRLPTFDEAMTLADTEGGCNELWPNGWITWTLAVPGARQTWAVNSAAKASPWAVSRRFLFPPSVGYICVQQ